MSDRPRIPNWLEAKVAVFDVPHNRDSRGSLTPVEFHMLPFTPKRIFFVSGSAPGVVRGKHGQRTGTRLLMCTAGEIHIEMRIGENAHSITLRPDGVSLVVQSGVWMQETYTSMQSVLAVLSDLRFDEEVYFHDP